MNILDISQAVHPQTACFPGDTPFSLEVQRTLAESGVVNLTRFQMSPHVGTHADAPSHIDGTLTSAPAVGSFDLAQFIGPAWVVDVSPTIACLTPEDVLPLLPEACPPRVLFKTQAKSDETVFLEAYASFSPPLVDALAARGVQLMGLDTPSVDPVDAKTLPAHHALHTHRMVWLENLNLNDIAPGAYTLVALPMKLTQLEAAPVRAVLIQGVLGQ